MFNVKPVMFDKNTKILFSHLLIYFRLRQINISCRGCVVSDFSSIFSRGYKLVGFLLHWSAFLYIPVIRLSRVTNLRSVYFGVPIDLVTLMMLYRSSHEVPNSF